MKKINAILACLMAQTAFVCAAPKATTANLWQSVKTDSVKVEKPRMQRVKTKIRQPKSLLLMKN